MDEKNIEKCIRHIILDGCDDVIKPPFFNETPEIKLSKSKMITGNRKMLEKNLNNFFISEIKNRPDEVGGVQEILVPKGRYTFRQIKQISLLDTLKYTSLVFSLGTLIEKSRLKKDIVFSNRFTERKIIMLDRTGYDKFRQKSKELSEISTYKVKIITDISNFYDRLNLHQLENMLLQIKCDKKIVTKINTILLTWSAKKSFGIPVGSDASRLLAEAMLINVDKELQEQKIKFIRYVDDYRIFTKNQIEAYEAMQILTNALAREGLFLNSGKTKIIDLTQSHDEEGEKKDVFDAPDPNQKTEKMKTYSTGYATRIAKYFQYPGQEAIKEFQKINLKDFWKKISAADAHEDNLKKYVKASLYTKKPEFQNLEICLDIYPHLFPYVCDGIVKSIQDSKIKFNSKFLEAANTFFQNIFINAKQNDYLRIQSARALLAIDTNGAEFLSKKIFEIDPTHQILFSQLIMLLSEKIDGNTALKLKEKFSDYGEHIRTTIFWYFITCSKMHQEGLRPIIKHMIDHTTNPSLKLFYRELKNKNSSKKNKKRP